MFRAGVGASKCLRTLADIEIGIVVVFHCIYLMPFIVWHGSCYR